MKIGILFVGLMLLVAPSRAEEKWLWRLNLTPGQTYVLTTESSSLSVAQSPANNGKTEKIVTENLSQIAMDYDVLARDEKGVATIKTTYRTFENQTTIRGPEGVRFSSKQPPANAPDFQGVLQSLVGVELQFQIAPDGKVLKVEGIEKLLEKLDAALEKIEGDKPTGVFKNLFGSMFSEEKLRQMTEKSIGTLPAQAVAIGESWNYKFELPLGATPTQITGQRTLKARENGRATIAETAEFSTQTESEPLPTSEIKVKSEFSGHSTGVSTVDEATGLTLESHLTQKMSGKISVTLPDKPTQTTPLSVDTEIVTTIKPRRK